MKSTLLAILLVIGLVIVVGLFLALRPQPSSTTTAPTTPPSTTEPTPSPTVDRFEVTLTAGKNAAGSPTYKTTEGRTVTFVVSGDKAGEFHVHGYDLTKALIVGESIELTFAADKAGRFELEYHPGQGNHVGLGALEVQPR